jgi:hypothetical protein
MKVHSRDTAQYVLATDDEGSFRPVANVHEWNPSECITDAWVVVEELARCQYEVGVQTIEGRYTALIALKGQASAMASAETAPHAICLAAIQAYGYRVEKG